SQSTVWILPLQSMREQYVLRCKQHGLSHGVWSLEMMQGRTPPLHILVSVENADLDSFLRYIMKLVADGRIARIIVDEAHLVLLHELFREVMNTLHWAGAQGVQIVLLSATVPPSLEGELFNKFGVKVYTVCRTRTSRPNLSYNVIRADSVVDKLDEMVT